MPLESFLRRGLGIFVITDPDKTCVIQTLKEFYNIALAGGFVYFKFLG